MKLRIIPVIAAVGTAALCGAALPRGADAQAKVSFTKDVLPVLQRRCSTCHSPTVRSGKLSVVTYAALKSGGISGPSFVSGKPADSPLYKPTTAKSPTMPKAGPPLSPKEQDTLRLWIAQGG